MTTKLDKVCTFVKEMKELFGGEYDILEVTTDRVILIETTTKKEYDIDRHRYTSNIWGAGVCVEDGMWTVMATVGGEEVDLDTYTSIDLFNIKPHEYGMLKLKYGLDKEDLYIPSFARGWVKL